MSEELGIMTIKEHFDEHHQMSVKNGGGLTWEQYCQIRKAEMDAGLKLLEKYKTFSP